MAAHRFELALLHPRYWLTWLGIGVWALLVQLPFPLLVLMGTGLGKLVYRFNHKRRKIAARDLEICYPEKTMLEREQILKKSFESIGIAAFETAIAWFWPSWRLRRLYTVEGREHVERAHAENNSVLMLGTHLTTLDIGGAFMGLEFRMGGMYRTNRNAAYDWVQRWGRQSCRPDATFISSDNVRGLIKHLRQGGIFWYAPDQDHGAKGSVFVSYFNVPTAMITATATFARMGKAAVVPVYQQRLPGAKGYKLIYLPALESFPSGDDNADAQVISDFIERIVREQPEQYLWIQRRFKTRPKGVARLY